MLTVRDLHAGYRGHPVIDGINLDVASGEMVALIGPNGCGKTTLLRAITGVVACDGGTISIDGIDARTMNPAAVAKRVAVVAQGAALPERFSALQVAMMGRTPHLRLLQSEGRRDLDIVRAAMLRVDCWPLRDRFVEELSGGERQRVVIARALAQQPGLLLLDEPTSHLDLQHQVETFRTVTSLCRDDGLAVIAVVHDLTLAAMFADRIVLMSGGRLVAEGVPAAVLRPEVIEDVYGTAVRVLTLPDTDRPVVVPDVAADVGRSRRGQAGTPS